MPGHLVAASEASRGKMHPTCRDLRAEKPRVASGGMLMFTASVDRVWAGLVAGAVAIVLGMLVPLKELVAAGTHRLMQDCQGIVYGGAGSHLMARPPRQSLRDQSAVEN
ncbi:hypothetical protein GGF44_003021 [Coemansia sp. RSA 1694]|nr:hypothetical protein GGF38_002292 [Coemansia sp. RSA 25]KAJ2495774.1 hypothetical protein IWW47_003947 [Coemansia sp. RSA 2052]KAJ2551592.1 hypothetical protein GGH95_005899 [Coemansia sp. RSA 1836]KAJ2636994.1 hypothetical protein GGF44_003021 [Coemansia sp. RSA 1694]